MTTLRKLQSQIESEAVELFDDYLEDGKRLFTGGKVNFTEEEWRQECKDYLKEKLHQATQRVAEESYKKSWSDHDKGTLWNMLRSWLNHSSEGHQKN